MQALKDSLKYRQWLRLLDRNGVELSGSEELYTVRKPGGEILFSMLRIDARAEDGQKLLPIVLLRGHFVSVLTCLIDSQSRQRHLLLVKQYRVANGAVCYEHPAGMCDEQADPYEVAVKEVQEETGFAVRRDQLRLMNDRQMLYTSPGLLDEGGYLFYCEIELPAEQIQALHDQAAGDGGEHEFIQTAVVPLEQALSLVNSVTSVLQILWYERFVFSPQ